MSQGLCCLEQPSGVVSRLCHGWPPRPQQVLSRPPVRKYQNGIENPSLRPRPSPTRTSHFKRPDRNRRGSPCVRFQTVLHRSASDRDLSFVGTYAVRSTYIHSLNARYVLISWFDRYLVGAGIAPLAGGEINLSYYTAGDPKFRIAPKPPHWRHGFPIAPRPPESP
jgi:hypothetical protein